MVQPCQVHFALDLRVLQDGFDFRRVDKQAIGDRVIKRVDAEMIASEKKPAFVAIVNREDKLAVELVEEVDAVLLVEMKQDFDIRFGPKRMALL